MYELSNHSKKVRKNYIEKMCHRFVKAMITELKVKNPTLRYQLMSAQISIVYRMVFAMF